MTTHPVHPHDELSPVESRLATELAAGLARRAEAEGLLDIGYRHLDSPLGPLLLAATERGIVRVAFPTEPTEAVLDDLAARVSPRILEAPHRLDAAARALDGYFAGTVRDIGIPLDLALLGGFRREVVESLPTIGYGRTATYGALAARLGRPGAARAVGTGCAKNPLPIVLPCHRVVPASGGVGAYRGGPDAKRLLLDLEAER